MIGNFVNAIVRDIAHRYVLFLGCLEVDIVDTDTVTHDHSSVLHRGNHVTIDRCKLSDDGVRISDHRLQVINRFVLAARDLNLRILQNGFLDLQIRERVVSDQHTCHGCSFDLSHCETGTCRFVFGSRLVRESNGPSWEEQVYGLR